MNLPGLMRALYFLLLIAGAIGFALHLYAQWRFVHALRTRYPDKWGIIARSDSRRVSRMRIWGRLQQVLRSNVPELFQDEEIIRWHRIWRYAPWLAWPCWIGVLVIQATMQ
jgi:hypothetical protein